MKHNVFGIQTNSDDNKFEDKFDVLYDDFGAFYESKETFHHEEEGLVFDYKFCVEIIDFEDANKFGIEFAIVPMFNSLCEKQKTAILSCMCVDEDQVRTFETYREGTSVMIGYEEVIIPEGSLEEGFYGCEPIMEKLNAIANVFESINGLRGFYLDKYVNRIGTTGWDMIDAFINGSDWTKTTLDQYKE